MNSPCIALCRRVELRQQAAYAFPVDTPSTSDWRRAVSPVDRQRTSSLTADSNISLSVGEGVSDHHCERQLRDVKVWTMQLISPPIDTAVSLLSVRNYIFIIRNYPTFNTRVKKYYNLHYIWSIRVSLLLWARSTPAARTSVTLIYVHARRREEAVSRRRLYVTWQTYL